MSLSASSQEERNTTLRLGASTQHLPCACNHMQLAQLSTTTMFIQHNFGEQRGDQAAAHDHNQVMMIMQRA